MEKTLKLALIATLALGLLALGACSDDDDDGDNGGTNPPVPEAWEGTWLSAEDDVAPILVTVFDYDSVRVSSNGFLQFDGTTDIYDETNSVDDL